MFQNRTITQILLLKNASYRKLQGKLLIREQTDLFLMFLATVKQQQNSYNFTDHWIEEFL